MKNLLIKLLVITFFGISFSQSEKCGTMKNWQKKSDNNPAVKIRMESHDKTIQNWIINDTNQKNSSKIITIPVVVHVLYNTELENISDDQIYSQIGALNEDFRLLNSDSLPESHPFWMHTADCQIEFCLASIDPNGGPTDGITRTYTDSVSFSGEDYEKFDAHGGKDNWDPTKYLNIWVCNLDLTDGTLGYAAFPSDLEEYPELDGVVIRYEAFGTIGTAGTQGWETNNMGRTATHEVGHWLNLLHIWGDDNCGDDSVEDTPPAEGDNAFCPTFPHNAYNSCGSDDLGEMYMNYMDYVDDECMVMFTSGQKERMLATLYNSRLSLLSSNGCEELSQVQELEQLKFTIFPNPSNGEFNIRIIENKANNIEITISDILGNIINHESIFALNELQIKLHSKLDKGIYIVTVATNDLIQNQLVVIK